MCESSATHVRQICSIFPLLMMGFILGETQTKIYVGNATVRSPGICEEHSLKHAIRTHHCESYVAKLDRLRNHGHTLFAHNIGVGLSRRSASSTMSSPPFSIISVRTQGIWNSIFVGPVFPQPRGGSKMVFQE